MLGSICSAQTYPPNDPHWGGTASNNWASTPVWHDDFTTLPLGTITNTLPFHNNWSYGQWGDSDHEGEPQAYRANNIAVVPDPLGGTNCIALTAKQESYNCTQCASNPKSYINHYYTSGQIGSNGPRQIRYGYVEATIRVPDNYGLWPAFWLWTCTPAYNEIDMFEDIPGAKQDQADQPLFGAYLDRHSLTSNIHYRKDTINPTKCEADSHVPQINPIPASVGDYASAFHKYGVEWTPSKIIYYIDGRVYRNTINPEFKDTAYNTPGKISAPGINIIINLALNSFVHYPLLYDHTKPNGNIDYFDVPPWYTAANPSSINLNANGEATMYIREVKYYSLPPIPDDGCSQNTFTLGSTFNWANPTASGYHYTLLNKDVVTNGAVTVPTGSANIIRATHRIVINGPFTMSSNASLYLDVNPCH